MRPLLILAALLLATPALAKTERIAVVVGNRAGDASRPELRHAHEDALSFAAVFEQLGQTTELELLLEQDAAALERVFDGLVHRTRDRDVELVFYYSGHADDTALLLGPTRYPFSALKERLQSLPVRLYIAIVDACHSGGLVRRKGAVTVAIDEVEAGPARDQQGGVLITSAAPRESAFESDELEASVFSSALVSGLRGAADDSGDGRVSLEEAYRYAYELTVARTAGSLLGAQHPSFDWSVRGRDQLVLTWLEHAESALVLPRESEGLYVVRSTDRRVVGQFQKSAGRPMRVALGPGTYQVSRRHADQSASQELRVERGATLTLDERRMFASAEAEGRAKGGAGRSLLLGVGYGLRSGFLEDAGVSHEGRVSLWSPLGPVLGGIMTSVRHAGYQRRDRLDVVLTELDLRLGAAWPFALGPRLTLLVGAEAGLGAALQSASSSPALGGEQNAGLIVPFEGSLGLRTRLGEAMAASLEIHGGGVAYQSAEVSVGAAFGARLSLGSWWSW